MREHKNFWHEKKNHVVHVSPLTDMSIFVLAYGFGWFGLGFLF